MACFNLATPFDLVADCSVAPFTLLKVAEGDKGCNAIPAVAVKLESLEQLDVLLPGPDVPSAILANSDSYLRVCFLFFLD
jgi:hypothetical protein